MSDDDPATRADLEREIHYMQTQVEQHGFPGTRAVLAELDRLSKENALHWRAMKEAQAQVLKQRRADIEQVRSLIDTVEAEWADDGGVTAAGVRLGIHQVREQIALRFGAVDVTPDPPPTDKG